MCFKHYIRQKRGGSKMKILALSTQFNQIFYKYSVGPQKARNAKTNQPKWGGGRSKMKIWFGRKG